MYVTNVLEIMQLKNISKKMHLRIIVIIATDLATEKYLYIEVIEIIVDGIRTEWGKPGDEGVGWNGREGGWQGARVLDAYDLIRDELSMI
jgi:hypothetical protein